jgi:hypothetical protein
MIQYFTDSDESTLIGVAAVDRSAESIVKAVSKLLDTDFVEADSDEFDDLAEFEVDTVVIDGNDFTEELLELLEKDIKVYLV